MICQHRRDASALQVCADQNLHLVQLTAMRSCIQVSTALNVNLDGLPGSTAPFPKFDPLGLANVGGEETYNWFSAAELKHGRVAMLATTGFFVQAAGIHFPGMLSSDISFESLSGLNPVDQWAAVPDAGMFASDIEWFVGTSKHLTLYCTCNS